jgi:ABC-type transport system substrate-binding protein
MRFYLRNDITWQDGTPVTADDIIWNFNYIAHVCPDTGTSMPEYLPIWSVYQGCVKVNDYTADVYINTTGHWKVLDYEDVALQFPRVIWQNLLNYSDITAFKPWKVSYATQVGHAPPNGLAGLSCLIGTGPWFLNMTAGGWDELGLCVLSKYPGYWKRLTNPADLNLDMAVNEDDLWFFCAQFITYYKLGYAHVFCDYDRNVKMDEDDLWYFCTQFVNYYKYGLHGP